MQGYALQSFAIVATSVVASSGVAAWASDRANVSFYESCEPTDSTVRGDLECRGAKLAQAQLNLESALSKARAAIVDRSQRLTTSATESLASAKSSTEADKQTRESAKEDMVAANEAVTRFDLEQQRWKEYADTACSYLHSRQLYGANGPSVFAPACEINIIKDRTHLLLAELAVASNYE